MKDFDSVVEMANKLLLANDGWKAKYGRFAEEILRSKGAITAMKGRFRVPKPLHLYMSVTGAKKASMSSVHFDLRYLGQSVADLAVSGKAVRIKTHDENNRKFFGCNVKCAGAWSGKDSKDAGEFRRHFKTCPKRDNFNKSNDEHRIESMLLTEFEKKDSRVKAFKFIQPVKIGGIARFQMPAPFKASSDRVAYLEGSAQGHLDILARVGNGRRVNLCIMEVKDEYSRQEKPSMVIEQALYYAVFIRALLRSDSGAKWWRIFGFGEDSAPPSRLKLLVCSVMPFNPVGESDRSFSGAQLMLGDDILELHHMYFSENGAQITGIETSISCE